METLSRIVIRLRTSPPACSWSASRSLHQRTVARIISNRTNCFKVKPSGLLSAVNTINSNPSLAAMSSKQANIKIVTYDDVKKLKDSKDTLLIDVREPSELQETGVLPGSINIPVGEVEKVLKNTSAEQFANQYGRPKPDSNFPLVFSCKSGRRSEMAAEAALKLGYKDVSSYGGGWLDWEENSKQ